MKNTATFKDASGTTVSVQIDIDSAGTHKKVREAVEEVFAKGAETIRRKARAISRNAVFKIGGQSVNIKSTYDVFRVKAKGKNITNKTDKFLVENGQLSYPGKPHGHPAASLAKPAHVEIGTVKNSPMPSIYPAYDGTKGEILSALDGCV